MAAHWGQQQDREGSACSEMTGDISMKSISGAQGREGVINTLINTVIHPSLVRCIM